MACYPWNFSIKWRFCFCLACVFKCYSSNAKSVSWDTSVKTIGLLWDFKKRGCFPSCLLMGCGKGCKITTWCFCNTLVFPEKNFAYFLYAFQLEVFQNLWKLLCALYSFGVKYTPLCHSTEQSKGKQSTILWNSPILFPWISALCWSFRRRHFVLLVFVFSYEIWQFQFWANSERSFFKLILCMYFFKSAAFPIPQLWGISLSKYRFLLLCLKLGKYKYILSIWISILRYNSSFLRLC